MFEVKPERKRLPVRQRGKYQDDIKIDLRERKWVVTNCIDLAQD
jgi:hypothetical protein